MTTLATFSELVAMPLLRRSLIEVVVVGALNGAVGVHVVLRRMPFFAMTLAHGSFPGLVLASLAGVSLLLGAWAFALVIVAATALLGTIGRLAHTSAIGVVLTGSFALGALLIATQDGFTRDLAAFLVGSVVTVSTADVVATILVALATAVLLAGLHKELVLGAFDPAALEALGYPARHARRGPAGRGGRRARGVGARRRGGAVGGTARHPGELGPALGRRRRPHHGPRRRPRCAERPALGLAASHQWDVAAGGAIVLAATSIFVVSLVLGRRSGLLRRRPNRRPPAALAAGANSAWSPDAVTM